MQNYLIFRAQGNNDVNNGCRYSLLQYLAVYNLHPPADIAIVVFTDRPSDFDAFIPYFTSFSLKELTAKQLSLSETSFLEFLINTFPGNVLYLNTNVYITQPLQQTFQKIQQGSILFLSAKESFDNELIRKKSNGLIKENELLLHQKKISLPATLNHFNTDAIGFSNAAVPLLNKIELLQEQLQKNLSKETALQLAFNACLQQNIFTLPDCFKSFTYFPEFNKLLQLFFTRNAEESIPNMVKQIHHLDACTIKMERDRYLQLPFYKKFWNTLTGKAWSIQQYQNKI